MALVVARLRPAGGRDRRFLIDLYSNWLWMKVVSCRLSPRRPTRSLRPSAGPADRFASSPLLETSAERAAVQIDWLMCLGGWLSGGARFFTSFEMFALGRLILGLACGLASNDGV